MLTKDDRKFIEDKISAEGDELREEFKSDLATELTNQRRDFERKTEQYKNEVVEVVREEARKVRSDIAKFKTEILGDYTGVKEELAVTEGYSDQLEEHEGRIEKLEKKVFA